jgi:hypothetical protein
MFLINSLDEILVHKETISPGLPLMMAVLEGTKRTKRRKKKAIFIIVIKV